MAEGSCLCKLHDGNQWHAVKLEVGVNAVYVPNLVWHDFCNFSEGASLVALSSTSYNPNRNDYIQEFDMFIKELNKNV
jgi:dTDP-4-dehydrorhamnose 3,5-epimerase-like enzyme